MFVSGKVLVQSVGRVDGVEFFSSIFARVLEDDFRTTRVFCREGLTRCGGEVGQETESVPGRNSVTSYALPCTITQHESFELCFAISSPVKLPMASLSPLSLFMVHSSLV